MDENRLWYDIADAAKFLELDERIVRGFVSIGFFPRPIKITKRKSVYDSEDLRMMVWLVKNRHRFRRDDNEPDDVEKIVYVYFVQDASSLAIKIGFSKSPKKRTYGLNTGNQSKLNLLGCIYGDRKKESELHERFAEHRLSGEWFSGDITNEVLMIIEKHGVGTMDEDGCPKILDS